MRYLIIYQKNVYIYDSFTFIEGMIVVDFYTLNFTTDGENWVEVEKL